MMDYWIIIAVILSLQLSSEDTNCVFDENLKLDKRIFVIHQEIDLNSNDTLIIYRHQIRIDQDYGYVRITQKSTDKTLRKDISYQENPKRIIESIWYEIEDVALANIYSKINSTIRDSVSYPALGVIVTHFIDGLHTIQIYSDENLIFCKSLAELDLIANQYNPKNELLLLMRDTSEFNPSFTWTNKSIVPLYFINDKPVFHEDPKLNRKIRKEYNKLLKKRK